MSAHDDLLQFLRAYRDTPVLSVYLEAPSADPARRREREVRLGHQVAAARAGVSEASRDERATFERLVRDAQARIATAGGIEGGGSWACFCPASGDVLVLPLPEGVETSVHWGRGANVVPYVRASEPEAALIAQIDHEHVRLTRLEEGRLETLLDLEAAPIVDAGIHTSEGPRPGFHPGVRGHAGADEVQRQRREETERMRRALLQRLVEVPGPGLPVVMGGAAETVARLMKDLPAAVAERAAQAPGLRMDDPRGALPVIRGTLHELQARRLGQRAEELCDTAKADGLATMGLEQAVRAAANGAVAELIFSDRAWRAHPDQVEALVRRVLLDGAAVGWTDSADGEGALDGDSDGLVAGLRFVLSRR